MAFYWNDSSSQATSADASGNSDQLKDFIAEASMQPSILKEKSSAIFLSRKIAVQLCNFLLQPIEDEEDIDISLSLQEFGLDSLVALELRSWWKQTLGFDISVLEMLGMGSIEMLGERAAKGLAAKLEVHAGDENEERAYLAMKAP